MTNFCEIPLTEICANPRNPRRRYDQKKLDELTASVKQKGVIEPIIVRPLKKGKATYEIVAGERRFRAAAAAGLAVIPAIVRELTDDEAYDFMIIENLQRDDLTDREEAESFKSYAERHGLGGGAGKVMVAESIVELAEKTGISPAYIRGRVRVLELPANVLKAWDEGKIVFGHLQQLLRVSGDPKALKKMTDDLMSSARYEGVSTTVGRLRQWINDMAPALSGAFFPMNEPGVPLPCCSCGSNSIIQKDLFDVDADKARCLNPACFKKRQNDYLAGHWKETSLAKAHGTNGFRFEDRHRQLNYHNFRYGPRPAEKCKECPNFITIIELDGTVETAQACFGKRECFDGEKRGKKKLGDKPRDPEAPRASWHGEFHRDVFLSKRIPEQLAKLDVDDPMIKMLLLACAIHGNKSIVSAREDYSGAILQRAPVDQLRICKAIIEKIVLSGQHVGPSSWNGFGTKGRRIVAEYLAVDLAKEYAVDADYLAAKTKAEILAFGKKFKLFDKNVDPVKLKKGELVKVVLAHGPKLVGMVPAEILK